MRNPPIMAMRKKEVKKVHVHKSEYTLFHKCGNCGLYDRRVFHSLQDLTKHLSV